MKTINILLISMLLMSSQTWGQTAQKERTSAWKTYGDQSFSINYPGDWSLDTTSYKAARFILLSSPSSAEDRFKENINLIVQNLEDASFDLDKFSELSISQVKTMINNSKILESKRMKANGLDFHKIVYSGTQGEYKLSFEQYYWVMNQKAYVLTFTSELNQFEAYREVAEQIMNSLKLY